MVGFDRVDVTPDWGIEPAGFAPCAADLALLLEIAASCNDAHLTRRWRLHGRPDGDRAARGGRAGSLAGHLRPRRMGEVPFDSERKRMTTIHDREGARVAYVKGGADVVLALCTHARIRGEIVDARRRRREQRLRRSERRARLERLPYARIRDARVLDAYGTGRGRELERDLTYVGILGLVDPPRAEVAEAHRGVPRAPASRSRWSPATTRSRPAPSATQIGLLDEDATAVVTGAELAAMTDEELCERVEDVRIYARVNPEHKLRIVDGAQAPTAKSSR